MHLVWVQSISKERQCVWKMAQRYLKRSTKAPNNKFFFIDRRLHRILRINRPANLVEAWSFEDHEKVTLLYTDYRQKSVRAFRTKEAATILNVSRKTLDRAWMNGNIHRPVQSYPIGNQNPDNHHPYWWGLWNILEAHEYMLTVPQGRPRKDGLVMPNQRLPTRAEVIARAGNEVVLFSKSDAEHYIPVYSPPEF